ncbi:MAG: alpha/beta hydrolase [Myxococcaceae bacterium]
MRIAWLVMVGAVLGSGCVAGNLASGALVRPMRVPVVGAPALAHEDFEVTSPDGIALMGWTFSPEGTPRGVVVLVHGKDINRQHFSDAAARFVGEGFAVVAYDQRAHGASTGEFVTYGEKEVPDLRAVIDVAEKKWGRGRPVVLIGESLGAAVSLQTAAVDERVSLVVAAASFADLSTMVSERAPFFLDAQARAKAVEVAEREAGFKVADISPVRAAREIRVPVLLLHGSEDAFVPLRHSLRIYEALGGEKAFVRLEGVGHIDVLLTAPAWEAIDAFVAKELPAGELARSPLSLPSGERVGVRGLTASTR